MSIFSSTRRSFFRAPGLLAALGSLPGAQWLAGAMAARSAEEAAKVYTRLGLRPIINAAGTYTHLGGSLMPLEVIEAMEAAAQNYVPIGELSRTVGARIAEVTGNPAALVTTGAAGAIFVSTCACIAGNDPDKAKRLPFTEGMKNEIVTQKMHMTGWIRQCEAAGGRMVDVEYKDEMERAIGGKTAMLYYLVAEKHFGAHRDKLDAPGGKVSLEECIQIAKKYRIPLLIDAAAELPPFENLAGYTKMGADLVAFSGGKGLRGPQNAGMLVGRKDLIGIAETFQSPHSGIGRDLKISKETYIGMLAAVERYVKTDHRSEWNLWKSQIDYMKSELDKIPGVETGYVPGWVTNHVPRLWVKWDEKAWNFSREDCFKALDQGDPRIVPLRTPMGITLVPWMMAPGQERIVTKRMREVLDLAKKTAHQRPRRTVTELAADFRMDNPIDAWDPPGHTRGATFRERAAR
ncbi:MAG TPA: aminotransferase class V-fold PLP-dependent enzyme [Bryobacteraceae bacterium]|nr:aminotransferase class V-fold PLP-dependent enzyme [Bryobacteraceae bacterium]